LLSTHRHAARARGARAFTPVLDAHLNLNRPGFPRGLFVQNSGGFFKGVQLCMEFILHFLRRPMADSAM
jgi:hypothetical protein